MVPLAWESRRMVQSLPEMMHDEAADAAIVYSPVRCRLSTAAAAKNIKATSERAYFCFFVRHLVRHSARHSALHTPFDRLLGTYSTSTVLIHLIRRSARHLVSTICSTLAVLSSTPCSTQCSALRSMLSFDTAVENVGGSPSIQLISAVHMSRGTRCQKQKQKRQKITVSRK